MPILKYHPPIKKLLDKRKTDGGYYEAECENCGTKFYPERSNAKYCSPNCGLVQHRIAVANGTAMKRGGAVVSVPKKSKAVVTKDSDNYSTGKRNLYDDIVSAGVNLKGLKGDFLEFVTDIEIGTAAMYRDILLIMRLSEQKFQWKLPK